LIKGPHLSLVIVDSGLDNKVIASSNTDDSFHPQSGLNVEWSVDMKTSVGVKAACSCGILSISVEDSPSERRFVLLSIGFNIDSFGILVVLNAQDFALLVVEVVAVKSEELVPV